MRIIILGAGVIGVTCAYELAQAGMHDITVIDAGANVATEASAANASMIASGHAYAWASPKVPKILLKSLYRNDQAFRIRLRLDRQFWQWTALFLQQCNNADAEGNTICKHMLCQYSQQRLASIAQDGLIEFDQIQRGLLYLFRDANSFQKGVLRSKILSERGQETQVLRASEIVDLEPAYWDERSNLAGGIYCPTDETGSAQKFTQSLARICVKKKVSFLFNTQVNSLVAGTGKIECLRTSKGDLQADLFIVSLGAQTPLILKSVNINLPIYPVKGYSLTYPIRSEDRPPTIGTIDEDNLVAMSRIGNAFRATSTAEFCGYDLGYQPKDFKPMIRALKNLVPNAANYDQPTYRACLRPMTPQGTPYIGFSRYENLFVNSGHGHLGWTMACGSAKITADLIAGVTPEIDVQRFQLT